MAYMVTEAQMTPDETPYPEDCSWRCIAGLPNSIPELGDGAWSRFNVPLHGGVFKFRFSCEGIPDSDAILVLPLAGASMDEIVSNELDNADSFANSVIAAHPTVLARNRADYGKKWFVQNGAGDFLGRPDNQSSPTVWYYNQINERNDFGAVVTWGGKCVRLTKLSNFFVAYACQKIGVTDFNQTLSQLTGTRNGLSAEASWECGVDLANGIMTLSACARVIGTSSWLEGDEKVQRLWPNLAPADNLVEPNSFANPNTQFTVPGFLRMSEP